jgi:molybdopterin synthase sulfur carrier subunit
MEIEILSFGKIAEFIKPQKLNLEGITDTDGFQQYLEKTHPQLQNMKYKLALNKQLVQSNTMLNHDVTIAIMPPFSGG